jgi:hypothetical protein
LSRARKDSFCHIACPIVTPPLGRCQKAALTDKKGGYLIEPYSIFASLREAGKRKMQGVKLLPRVVQPVRYPCAS